MSHIQIGEWFIGREYPPFIIAEVGINHNGELDKAYAMIKVAKEAGASAVKFQTFKAEEFIGDSSLTFTYQSQGEEITESMLEMFKRYEFTRDAWFKIKQRCDEEEILFLSTPQNRSDLDLLLEVGITAIKVGSDDFTNFPLLKSYAQTKLPMIISCGMSDLAEVYKALETIGSLDGYSTVLLLCTSQYPTPPEDVNLRSAK
jgi:N,N'-diacetyllegionaminate synthase